MPNGFEKAKRKSLRQRWQDNELAVEYWFERDRAFIGIQDVESGEYLAEWWDGDVAGLVEDGYFYWPGIGLRIPSEIAKLKKSVIDYAEQSGVPAYKGRIAKKKHR